MSGTATRPRSAPPLLLAAGLLLWGWQTGFLVYAAPMGVLLELPHWVKWRWEPTAKEFNLASDISGLVFFILVVYIFSKEGAGGIYRILAIMPFILCLLVFMQVYSREGTLKLSVLFISLRRLEPDNTLEMNREIDISLPYFLLCIISASSGNKYPALFFLVCSLFMAALLWSFRPHRYHAALWVVLLGVSLSIGYAGQLGMRQAQRSIEFMLMEVFEKYMWRYRDPDRASTAIGSLGRIKLSDRILLRVDTEKKLEQPLLLREASYTNYGFGVWSNVESEFQLVDPDITPQSWTLQQPEGGKTLTLSTYMFREIGVVPVPHGITNIYDINAFDINRNRYGAIRMETTEGWIQYKVDYDTERIRDSAPDRHDLFIPERYRDDFNRLADEWQLEGKQTVEIIDTVQRNFAENYSYSLENRNRYPRGQYLHHFLFENREGHCEFFATSTVLLLRAAGIPARYAVGYSVNEYSDLEDRYIVRGRDAHSWTLAYVNGEWQIVDTTPSIWLPLNQTDASSLEPLFDLFAWLKYRFARWQTEDELAEAESDSDYLLWLLPPLILFLIWRLSRRERQEKEKPDETGHNAAPETLRGYDSPLYTLVARLEQHGYLRRPGETLAMWFKRINPYPDQDKLLLALELHYRYRFDPADNDSSISTSLGRIVDEIIAADLPEPDSFSAGVGVQS